MPLSADAGYRYVGATSLRHSLSGLESPSAASHPRPCTCAPVASPLHRHRGMRTATSRFAGTGLPCTRAQPGTTPSRRDPTMREQPEVGALHAGPVRGPLIVRAHGRIVRRAQNRLRPGPAPCYKYLRVFLESIPQCGRLTGHPPARLGSRTWHRSAVRRLGQLVRAWYQVEARGRRIGCHRRPIASHPPRELAGGKTPEGRLPRTRHVRPAPSCRPFTAELTANDSGQPAPRPWRTRPTKLPGRRRSP